jgi:hypothetical protein
MQETPVHTPGKLLSSNGSRPQCTVWVHRNECVDCRLRVVYRGDDPPDQLDRVDRPIAQTSGERRQRHTGKRPGRDRILDGNRCHPNTVTSAHAAIHRRCVTSIPGPDGFESAWPQRAPLGWDRTDAGPAAKACCALMSDWFPATTGTIVHVDGGFHATGT